MKKTLIIIILSFSLYSYSQQNFINVPSSEVTKKHKLFFQQQININELVQSNSTIDYGLGKGFEIGANVLGLNFSTNKNSFIHNDTSDKDPYNPLIMLNGLKSIELTKHIALAFGTQMGLNFRDNKKTTKANLVYGNLLFKDILFQNSSFVIGSYYNSSHYGGKGNRLGAWLGAEVEATKKIHVMAESVLGSNSLCYTSLGIILYPTKHIPLTFGVQLPNTKNNSYSFVFEFTFVP